MKNNLIQALLVIGGIFGFAFMVYYCLSHWQDLILGAILLFVVFVLFCFYIYYSFSKEKDKTGKLKDALFGTKQEISNRFSSITEPSAVRQKREAENRHTAMLKSIRDVFYRYTPELYYDNFEGNRRTLNCLGIIREQWLQEAYPEWYKGVIEKMHLAKEWPNVLDMTRTEFEWNENLKKALDYYGITEEEWANDDPKILELIETA